MRQLVLLTIILRKNYAIILINNLKNNTVFFITHRLATIKNSDLIIVMHDGKLDENGFI